jgi:DNA-binding transcriptional LysR family regulator
MPSYILNFQKLNPDVHIQLDDGSSEEMASSVESGGNDLAIVGRIPYEDRFDVIPFPGHEVDELMLVVPPSHPLAARSRVTLTELGGEGFILRQRGTGTRQSIEQAASEHRVDLNVILEAKSPEFIKDLVRQGVGLSILTRLSLEEEIRRGNLVGISFAHGGLFVSLDILVPKGGYRRPAVVSFLDYLESLRELVIHPSMARPA